VKNFTYYRPTSPDQAVGLLEDKWGKSELLAGGTDLLDLQKEYIAQPDRVISLNGINGLAGVRVVTAEDGGLRTVRIGANTTLAALAEHPVLKGSFPALTTAAGDVAGPQIRNVGTLGGNLCQRNRCWYFRDEHTVCLLRGGDVCFALKGENRYHAVFTEGCKCVIVHPSTLAPALIALGAEVEILGPGKKRRTLPLAKFFRTPVAAHERETVLAPNEMVLEVSIPLVGLANASYEVRHKQAYDWPLVQAAAALQLEDKKVKRATIVLGHVAPTPRVAESAGKVLEGRVVDEESAAAAGRAAAAGAKPLSQNAYKVKLIEVAVKRAILLAAGLRPYWET
jgi:xanthine dehydrogenase YagS FAD-binding subunit